MSYEKIMRFPHCGTFICRHTRRLTETISAIVKYIHYVFFVAYTNFKLVFDTFWILPSHLAKFSKNRLLVVAELCNERWLQIHHTTHLTGLRRAVLHFSLYQCWYWHVSTSEYSLRQVRIHVISEEIHSINPLRPQGGRRSEEEVEEEE